MVSIEDDARFKQLYWVLSSATYEGHDPARKWIPMGTSETTNKNGSINWWDPVTRRAMCFGNVHWRNAWIILNKEKGVFKEEINLCDKTSRLTIEGT